jgi:hypothetical protein
MGFFFYQLDWKNNNNSLPYVVVLPINESNHLTGRRRSAKFFSNFFFQLKFTGKIETSSSNIVGNYSDHLVGFVSFL